MSMSLFESDAWKELARSSAAKRADKRALLVKSLGGEKAAKRWADELLPEEEAIGKTVEPFKRTEWSPDCYTDDGKGHLVKTGAMTTNLVGEDENSDCEPLPPSLLRSAIEHAIPLPQSIPETKAEFDFWRERERNMDLIQSAYYRTGDSCLPWGCDHRKRIIEDMLFRTLRAQTVAELLVRYQACLETHGALQWPGVKEALLADLEHLAGCE
jgi:hypothetical protein